MKPTPDPHHQVRAAVAELSRLLAILAGACLLGIWLADPGLTFLRSM